MQLIVRANQTHLLETAAGECVKDVKVPYHTIAFETPNICVMLNYCKFA